MNDYLQVFFESTTGKIIVVVILVVILLLMLIPAKNQKKKKPDTRALTISALMIALSMVLSQIVLFRMPQGGSVTLFSILPIVLTAYILGTRRGILAGVCVGLLNLIFGPYVIHPLQLIIDYPLAFGAMGLGGLCRNMKDGLRKGYLVSLLGRYFFAVLSGIIFFGSYAPKSFNAVTWSLWYNFTYLAVEGVITMIVISIPSVKKALEGLKKA